MSVHEGAAAHLGCGGLPGALPPRLRPEVALPHRATLQRHQVSAEELRSSSDSAVILSARPHSFTALYSHHADGGVRFPRPFVRHSKVQIVGPCQEFQITILYLRAFYRQRRAWGGRGQASFTARYKTLLSQENLVKGGKGVTVD